MSAADDLAEYLEDKNHGTVGTDIFAGNMPPSPDECIALYVYAGNPPDEIRGDFINQGVQIKVRSPTFDAGWGLADDVFQELHRLTDTTIENTLYYYIKATGSIMQMGTDQQGRHLFVMNFIAMKEV